MADGTEQGAEAAGVWSTVEAALTTWHAAHPAASFEELETAVEEQVGRLRAQLLGERVAAVAGAETPESPPPPCPACGTALQRRGRRARTLTARGGGTLRIERPYYTCPTCGSGLFPPG
jgi:YgiT-type zinc finger domain-containing protein